jgi:phosphoenolpyruvate carboxylase
MAERSLSTYRSVIKDDKDFVSYFRSLTPEQELGKLAIGSRPAKRKVSGGIESLRAIPWMFAWTQVRINLPSWLGMPQAIDYALQNEPDVLKDMLENWPFFKSYIDLIEMVMGKSDISIGQHYEQLLVEKSLHPLGQRIRGDMLKLIEQINQLKNQDRLLTDNVYLHHSISIRKPYLDPLNYIQMELLKRERSEDKISLELVEALKVTMTGIAAGMRNTG